MFSGCIKCWWSGSGISSHLRRWRLSCAKYSAYAICKPSPVSASLARLDLQLLRSLFCGSYKVLGFRFWASKIPCFVGFSPKSRWSFLARVQAVIFPEFWEFCLWLVLSCSVAIFSAKHINILLLLLTALLRRSVASFGHQKSSAILRPSFWADKALAGLFASCGALPLCLL